MAVAKKKKTRRGENLRARVATVQMAGPSGTVVQLATRVPRELYRELKLYAVTNSISISDLIEEAIQVILAKKGWKFQKAS